MQFNSLFPKTWILGSIILLMLQMETVEYFKWAWLMPWSSHDSSPIFQFWSQDVNNLIALTILSGEMFWSFAFIFFFCEFGGRVSDEFSELNDKFNQFDWYLLSIMVVAKQRVVLPVFGNITCMRDIFKKVSLISVFITWSKLGVFTFVQGNQSGILMLHNASSIRIMELLSFSMIILFFVSFLETRKTHFYWFIKRFMTCIVFMQSPINSHLLQNVFIN